MRERLTPLQKEILALQEHRAKLALVHHEESIRGLAIDNEYELASMLLVLQACGLSPRAVVFHEAKDGRPCELVERVATDLECVILFPKIIAAVEQHIKAMTPIDQLSTQAVEA